MKNIKKVGFKSPHSDKSSTISWAFFISGISKVLIREGKSG